MRKEPPLPQELWDRVPPEAQAFILALVARVDALEVEVAALRQENQELRERLNKTSRNSSKPPSSDSPGVKPAPPRTPSGRKRGGQPRHPRHSRPLAPPDKVRQTIDVVPPECRRCGQTLSGSDPDPRRHQVAELPPIEPQIDEYRLHRLTCTGCGTQTCGRLPSGVHGHFGPRLQAMLSLLSGAYRLGKRPIQTLASDLFGLSISLGMIAKLEQATSSALETPVDELRDYVRAQHANVDETSWREQRRKAWLWVAVTHLVTVFRIAPTRGGKVARDLLGADYAQVATCDRWSAYYWITRRQTCWSHLRRDFQAMIDRHNTGSPIGQTLLNISNVMFTWWHRVRDGTTSWATCRRHLSILRSTVREQLERGAACGCAKTAATCRELLADESNLWTFVTVEGIEPTNNTAERTLRHAVLWRKSSGGTDSPAGSRYVERILSVVATCRQQQRNVLEFLTAVCDARLHSQSVPSLLPAIARAAAA